MKYKGSSTVGILSALSILVSIGLLFLAWYVLLPNLQENQEKVLQAEVDIAEVVSKLEEVSDAEKVLSRINEQFPRFELSLPYNEQFPETIVSLYKLGYEVSLFEPITLSQSQAASSGEDYETSSINIQGSGYYENMISFVDNIYNNIRPVHITSISIAPEESDNEGSGLPDGAVSFTIDGYVYSKAENAIKATDADQAASSSANSSASKSTKTNVGSTINNLQK